MAFEVFHADKSIDVNPPISLLDALYNELAMDRGELPEVALQHMKGGLIIARGDGVVVWYNRWGIAKHMIDVPREQVLILWRLLARGQFETIEKQPWEDDDGFANDRRRSLTSDQAKRARAVYRVLGRLLGMRYSKFEVTHLRRGEPEETVQHWERIAVAFERFSAAHLLDERQEYALFDHLLEIAFDSPKAVAAGHQYWDELAATYAATGDRNTSPELRPGLAEVMAG